MATETDEPSFWQKMFGDRPYVQKGETYDTYADAYRHGDTFAQTKAAAGAKGRPSFDEHEVEIRTTYECSPAATKLPYDRARHAIRDAFERTIQLREERLQVGKERVQTGEATIRKEVITEHRNIDVPLQREELVIERHPVTGSTAAAGTIGQGETILVPLSEERATVAKNTVVTEEVSVGKKTHTDTKTVGADVRKEQLKVDNAANVKSTNR